MSTNTIRLSDNVFEPVFDIGTQSRIGALEKIGIAQSRINRIAHRRFDQESIIRVDDLVMK